MFLLWTVLSNSPNGFLFWSSCFFKLADLDSRPCCYWAIANSLIFHLFLSFSFEFPLVNGTMALLLEPVLVTLNSQKDGLIFEVMVASKCQITQVLWLQRKPKSSHLYIWTWQLVFLCCVCLTWHWAIWPDITLVLWPVWRTYFHVVVCSDKSSQTSAAQSRSGKCWHTSWHSLNIVNIFFLLGIMLTLNVPNSKRQNSRLRHSFDWGHNGQACLIINTRPLLNSY